MSSYQIFFALFLALVALASCSPQPEALPGPHRGGYRGGNNRFGGNFNHGHGGIRGGHGGYNRGHGGFNRGHGGGYRRPSVHVTRGGYYG